MVNSILRKDLEHSEETASKKYMGSWIAPWRFLRSDGFQRFMSGPVFSSLTKRLHWPPDIGPAVAACGRNIGNIWPILRNTVQSLAYKLTYISAIRRYLTCLPDLFYKKESRNYCFGSLLAARIRCLKPHCSEVWDAIARYIYTGLQGGSIMKGWMNQGNVIFKIERIDYEA